MILPPGGHTNAWVETTITWNISGEKHKLRQKLILTNWYLLYKQLKRCLNKSIKIIVNIKRLNNKDY